MRRLDALAPGSTPHASTRQLRGPTGGREETRILATPVARGDGTWIVLVGTSMEPTELAFDRVHVGLLVGGLIGIVAAAAGAWALARAALRPVESMRRQVAALRSRSVGRVAAPRTRDEVAALATTLNDLLDQIQEARELEQRLVADAGHELRTPLAVLRTELELAGRPDRSREDLVDAVAHAAVEVDRLNRLADALLFLARLDEGSPTEEWPVAEPVQPVARAAVRAVAERADRSEVDVRLAGHPSTAVRCDPDRLRQALDNLLDNAVRAAPAGVAGHRRRLLRRPSHDDLRGGRGARVPARLPAARLRALQPGGQRPRRDGRRPGTGDRGRHRPHERRDGHRREPAGRRGPASSSTSPVTRAARPTRERTPPRRTPSRTGPGRCGPAPDREPDESRALQLALRSTSVRSTGARPDARTAARQPALHLNDRLGTLCSTCSTGCPRAGSPSWPPSSSPRADCSSASSSPATRCCSSPGS